MDSILDEYEIIESTKQDKLVPVERVIDDMYSDDTYSHAARTYYYVHYATPEERVQMDREDRRAAITMRVVWLSYLGLLLLGLVVSQFH